MTSASPGARRQLDLLARSQPEAGPWLALIEAALEATADPAWDTAAANAQLHHNREQAAPLLTGATVPLDRATADGWVRRLLALAGEAGPETLPLRDAAGAAIDARAVLEAAVNQDAAAIAAEAERLGIDRGTLATIAQLAAVPLLQALRRRFAGAAEPGWEAGSCPVCGGWPTVAESRGLERARRLRCGRCGGDWAYPALRCPFCANDDHERLGSLVPEGQAEARRVETCSVCQGYVKQVATLRAWAGDEVALADLASVDLDLAALEHGFARPETAAWSLAVRVVEQAAAAGATP